MAIYSVSQINAYLKDMIERDTLLHDVWINGEVRNLTRAGSGHCYFSIHDPNGALRCVMFRNSRGSERLMSGASVIIHGRASVYQVRGELQLIVDIVQPEGVGELQLKLEQLKAKLENEGLFEQSRKRCLPEFPKRVGVITSPTGAVWHDIRTIVGRRYPLVELLLTPSNVQGEMAAEGIVEALQLLNEVSDLDAIILARGGGSSEDLSAFNEESVARAIYSSRAPVISAIGHETDVTLADLVSDLRASTPSAAAGMVVPDERELITRILYAQRILTYEASGILSRSANRLTELHIAMGRHQPDLDNLRLRIDELMIEALTHVNRELEVKNERTQGMTQRLNTLSPRNTLSRGYAIVQSCGDSEVVNDVSQLDVGDTVMVTVSRGSFGAGVDVIRE